MQHCERVATGAYLSLSSSVSCVPRDVYQVSCTSIYPVLLPSPKSPSPCDVSLLISRLCQSIGSYLKRRDFISRFVAALSARCGGVSRARPSCPHASGQEASSSPIPGTWCCFKWTVKTQKRTMGNSFNQYCLVFSLFVWRRRRARRETINHTFIYTSNVYLYIYTSILRSTWYVFLLSLSCRTMAFVPLDYCMHLLCLCYTVPLQTEIYVICFFRMSVLFETGELNTCVYDSVGLYRRKYVY